jgi:D-xylose transport system substrate-binding protein
VSVWKDARELGRAAGEAAVALCADPDISAVAGTEVFESPGGNSMTSILLEPIPITQDNLDIVIDAEWIDVDTLCQGVESGAVEACP